MHKENLIWHDHDTFTVLSDIDDWQLVFVMNHYRNEFWYELKHPDGHYLNTFYNNAADAIKALNQIKN